MGTFFSADILPDVFNMIQSYFLEATLGWKNLLKEFNHDVFHLPEYLSLISAKEQGKPMAVIAEGTQGKLLIPLIRREIDEGYWDAISPYGYSGPLYSKGLSISEMNALLQKTLEYLRFSNCVSLFLRTHPLLNEEFEIDSNLYAIQMSSTIVICSLDSDLSRFNDELDDAKVRRIRRLRREGFATFVSKNKSDFLRFAKLYRERMSELNAQTFYYFDDEFFENIAANLADSCFLRICVVNGEIVSGAIFFEKGGIINYFLGASNEFARNLGLFSLILEDERQSSRDRGCQIMILGGGVGGKEDSLLRFKKSFSSETATYHSYGFVTNREVYSDLSKLNDSEKDSDFFPLYRGHR